MKNTRLKTFTTVKGLRALTKGMSPLEKVFLLLSTKAHLKQLGEYTLQIGIIDYELGLITP